MIMKPFRYLRLIVLTFVLSVFFMFSKCSTKESKEVEIKQEISEIVEKTYPLTPFDSIALDTFFKKYPNLTVYKKQVQTTYTRHTFDYLWFDSKGRKETAEVLYNRLNSLPEEGLNSSIPYKETFEGLYFSDNLAPNLETELLLTTYYYFYTQKVLRGIDPSKAKELGWYLPRKEVSYEDLLDSLLIHPAKVDKQSQLMGQYYKLKEVLQKYQAIEKKGGWPSIAIDPSFKSFKPGDSSSVIGLIRTRLYLTNDLSVDSKSNRYDAELKEGLFKYQLRNGFNTDSIILPKHIKDMNTSIAERIKTLKVNMERCRWIPLEFSKANEFIVVNIPSFRMTYFKNGTPKVVSNVVVGNVMNKTVIFSGEMKHIVFSPYWNVPTSIINKEIKPGMARNKNYLAQHNMEWNGGNVRQKPGPRNSLGLVKFLFPNSNSIYLHDTPSKSLFNEETRAFSHGCIRVAKPKELAYALLEDDPKWTKEKIDAAMNKGKETWYNLNRKVPVYIGYFTAWVDSNGVVHFYKDVYNRDNRLAELLAQE